MIYFYKETSSTPSSIPLYFRNNINNVCSSRRLFYGFNECTFQENVLKMTDDIKADILKLLDMCKDFDEDYTFKEIIHSVNELGTWTHLFPRLCSSNLGEIVLHPDINRYIKLYYGKPSEELLDVYRKIYKGSKFRQINDNILEIEVDATGSIILFAEKPDEIIPRYVLETFLRKVYPKSKPNIDELLEAASDKIKDLNAFLSGINQIKTKKLITEKEAEISIINDLISRYYEMYITSMNRKDELNKTVCELMDGIDSTKFIEIITKYIDKNIIKLFKTSSEGELVMNITTELFNFNELAVKKIIDRTYSHSSDKNRQKLYKHALLSEDYSIMLSADVVVDFFRNNVYHRRCNTIYDNKVYNTHLAEFNCFGTNYNAICKALRDGDYESLIGALIACVGNLNFNDSTVILRFADRLEELYDMPVKFIRNNKTNKMLTYKEFLDEVK